MTPAERAEKIADYISQEPLDVDYIAAQIEEAERKAVERNKMLIWQSGRAEGFRAAREKAKEIAETINSTEIRLVASSEARKGFDSASQTIAKRIHRLIIVKGNVFPNTVCGFPCHRFHVKNVSWWAEDTTCKRCLAKRNK